MDNTLKPVQYLRIREPPISQVGGRVRLGPLRKWGKSLFLSLYCRFCCRWGQTSGWYTGRFVGYKFMKLLWYSITIMGSRVLKWRREFLHSEFSSLSFSYSHLWQIGPLTKPRWIFKISCLLFLPFPVPFVLKTRRGVRSYPGTRSNGRLPSWHRYTFRKSRVDGRDDRSYRVRLRTST